MPTYRAKAPVAGMRTTANPAIDAYFSLPATARAALEKAGQVTLDGLTKLGAGTMRKNEFGDNEYTPSEGMTNAINASERYGVPGFGGMAVPGGIIYHSAKAAKSPEIQYHERIHRAQMELPLPTVAAVNQAVSPLDPIVYAHPTTPDDDPRMEIPAHSFSESPELRTLARDGAALAPDSAQLIAEQAAARQAAYTNYIDMMYRLSGGRTQKLESSAAPELAREYTRYHARPYLPPPDPQMQEVNVFTGAPKKRKYYSRD